MFFSMSTTGTSFLLLGLLSSTICKVNAFSTPTVTVTPTSTVTSALTTTRTEEKALYARNRRPRYDDDYDDDYYYDDDDDDEYYEQQRNRRRRNNANRNGENRRRTNLDESDELSTSFLSFFSNGNNSGSNNNNRKSSGMKLPSTVSQSLLAGTFVLGIGTGVTVDSQINTSPKDLASRDAVDQAAPNPTLCTTYGASAMAFDQRVFVSFNPFNVYVAQADVKPACVLRPANVVPILEDKGLINKKEVKQCKDNMSNTWAFVGDLNDYPQLSCVYKSEDAQNEFLSNPKYGIGEDVYDDDRAVLEAMKSGKKNIKTDLTGGQKAVKAKAEALKAKNDALLLEKDSIDS
jgi:F0F1-type ATP synthase assembly protein I